MPPTGSTFTDWQQVDKESRLLMNEEFSWSEPPAPSRRRAIDQPIYVRRRATASEPDPLRESVVVRLPEPGCESWDQPTQEHSHFDEMMEAWNSAYGDGAKFAGQIDAPDAQASMHEYRPAAFDLTDPGVLAGGQPGRRTVLITGRGDDRYMPARRRPPSSELRFHERSTFSPDRAGLWAVLLGIALLIGCVVH